MNTSAFERLAAALADRYRIERELGAGGMATVYLAADLKHDRKVAIKVLKPELAAVLGAERFVVEIKTTAALQHPHILPLFDSGTADGFLFYVMPYIQGETIREKLNRETQFGVDEAVRIAKEVAGALDYAHRNGVIHRDIKPENLLLHDGRAMVMDFGIALAVSAAAGGRMTETGLSLGTPHYMSPEQATAEKEISPRSDVYSLASVLYEMLAGQPPHIGGAAQQVIMKIITEQAQPVTALRHSVPLNVAAALARALEKLPADRFESAAKFAEALGDVGYSHATIGVNVGGTSRAGVAATPRAFLAVSLLAAAAMAAALWGWLRPSAPEALVLRDRIVLWDSLPIPMGIVGRGLAISPDGSTLVFIERSGASTQLVSKERDRVDAAPVAGATGVAGGVTFSPDGEWIAFVGLDGRVKKVPRLGGSPISIADSAYVPLPALVWLDGGTVLFVSNRSGLRAVNEDGGPTRELNAGVNAEPVQLVRSLSGLPGGKGALVMICPALCATSELHVLDLRADVPTFTLLADQALAGWALPNGDVVFVRRDGGVFAAPFDMGTLTFSRPAVPVLDGVRSNNNTTDMAVSRGGSVVYVAGGGVANAADLAEPVWVDRSGGVTPIDSSWTIPIPASTLGQLGRRLALSPLGDRLALGIARDGQIAQSDIWVKQIERAPLTLTKLTFDDDNANPAWTRDGLRVVYTTGGLTRPGLVRRRRADGTGPVDTLFANPRGINDAVLTPDSTRYILRLLAPGSRDIFEGRIGDTTLTPMIASPASEVSPELSPDGRWLAYTSDESGQNEVYVRPYPDWGSGRWGVSQAGGSAPLWARSGRELFYRNGSGVLMTAAVLPGATFAMGPHTRLFDASGFAGANSSLFYDVAPGDRRFVMLRRLRRPEAPETREQLVQITNWASEVRAELAGRARR